MWNWRSQLKCRPSRLIVPGVPNTWHSNFFKATNRSKPPEKWCFQLMKQKVLLLPSEKSQNLAAVVADGRSASTNHAETHRRSPTGGNGSNVVLFKFYCGAGCSIIGPFVVFPGVGWVAHPLWTNLWARTILLQAIDIIYPVYWLTSESSFGEFALAQRLSTCRTDSLSLSS